MQPSPVPILAAGSCFVERGAPLLRGVWKGQPRRAVHLERMDRLCALSLCAADEVMAHAAARTPERSAVVFASAHGCHATDEAFYEGLLREGRRLTGASPRLFSYTLPSSPAGEISIHYGLMGPGLVVVSGLTAGLEALDEGGRCITLGRARTVVVVAAETGSALLDEIEEHIDDAAAAILLGAASADGAGAPLGYLREVRTAFCPGDPGEALRRALGGMIETQRLDGVFAYADSHTRSLLRAAQMPVRIEQEERVWPALRGSAAALLVVARLAERGGEQALVVSSDQHGSCAVLLWTRQP